VNVETSLEHRGQKISTLISGGLDSATLIAWAANEGYDQLAFFVDYGQDNLDREYACARINCQRFNVPLEIVNLRPLRDSFVGRFPFPINLYDCLVKNPLGQITTFALSSLVAGISVLADRYVLMLGIHHTDMELRPVLQKSMETLEEIAIEGRAEFLAAGGHQLRYIACLNDSPGFIRVLGDLVERNVQGWPVDPGQHAARSSQAKRSAQLALAMGAPR